jgi:hypothetical protein
MIIKRVFLKNSECLELGYCPTSRGNAPIEKKRANKW